MSRTKRWFVGAASAALLMGLGVPATSYADDDVETLTNYAGACEGDTGVTVVVDYQGLTGGAEVRCFTGDPADGVQALRGAGFTLESPKPFPDTAVCRINGRPAADETVPLTENPAYTEDCSKFPPANGYWSYYSSDDKGATWGFSQNGIGGTDPKPGDWEGWSFSLNADAGSNLQPRTDLALNAVSTQAAADWLADQWDPEAAQFASGLADSIIAFGAAKARPEIVSKMVDAMVIAAPGNIGGADSLAKMLIALDIAGQDTQHFLGCDRDLTAELDQFVADDANSLENYWGPHLVTIALNRLGKPVPQSVWDKLIARQLDGGFGDQDNAGLALSALVGTSENTLNPPAMRTEADTAIKKTVDWANNSANQKTEGGNYYWSTFSPPNSTGILGGALAEAGKDISSPQAFMRAQQKLTGVGAWSNTLNGTTANGMATTQGILAVAGTSLGKASLEVPRTTPTCAAPTFTSQPASTTATVGDTATFTVATEGHPDPTYTWELGIGGTWTTVNGASDSTLSFADVTLAKNGVKIRAVASNNLGSVTSDEATLTVKSVATTPPVTTPTAPSYPGAIYTTPGYHTYNGRNWFTTCEPYSVTQRCRTLIQATTVTQVNGKFVQKQGWAFNNLTYLASKKSAWKGNPLARTGYWTAADGRQWRTECNTPATGGNGCRSFAKARVVANVAKPGETTRYEWVTKEIFNNIVQFS